MLRALYSFGLRWGYNALFGTIMYSQVNAIFFKFGTESLSQHFFIPKTARTFSRASALPDSEWQMRCMQPPLPQGVALRPAPLQTWKTYKERMTLPSRIHSTISTLELVSTSMKVPAPCLLAYPNMLDSLSGNVRLVLNIGVPASSNFLPSMHIR